MTHIEDIMDGKTGERSASADEKGIDTYADGITALYTFPLPPTPLGIHPIKPYNPFFPEPFPRPHPNPYPLPSPCPPCGGCNGCNRRWREPQIPYWRQPMTYDATRTSSESMSFKTI